MQHRGAAGSDETTGDGGGMLFQIPHTFFTDTCTFDLPSPGAYGVAMVFLPRDPESAEVCVAALEAGAVHYGLKPMGWRDVPGNADCLGEIAKKAEPVIRQLFIDGKGLSGIDLERKLYMARNRTERQVAKGARFDDFYVCSMSCETICYKGMFLAPQLFAYYPDLCDPRMISALCVVHQRYSTNTFPSWQLAQPFRMVAHNGEINTLHGNINRIKAAEPFLESALLGEDLKDLKPVLQEGQSDSAMFDNVCQLLTMAGRSMPHAIMMMIPEAFGSRFHMSTARRSFYEYHAAIMEPWDGPAAMIFTDGKRVCGTLDRNGLRPCRYVVTTDGLAVMASEAGVIDFAPEKIQSKGRLQPGKMFLVDTQEGRIITDNEIKSRISRQRPYRRWMAENCIQFSGAYQSNVPLKRPSESNVLHRMRLFGYTREDLHMLLKPMGRHGQEPVGSMGNDVPLAVLSDRPKQLFQYFKQMFAQVTNPPIDPLREGLVMSLMGFAGKNRNLLAESPEHCRQLKLPHPILTNSELQRLRDEPLPNLRIQSLPAVFDALSPHPGRALKKALSDLVEAAVEAVQHDAAMLIISDKSANREKAPIPSLLATGAVHHGLLRAKLRASADLIIETAEAREVPHFCLLCGYGAFAVNPYLAFDALDFLQQRRYLPGDWKTSKIEDNFINAIKKGILKTISKMGISTLRSYRGAQLFESIGIDAEVIDMCFTGTSSRISGVGFSHLARETIERHEAGFIRLKTGQLELPSGGEYAWRNDGEKHSWNPQSITLLQQAVRNQDAAAWEKFSTLINDQSRELKTLRGLFEFKHQNNSVPLDEVEPEDAIVKRFCTGAMSHGSISKEVHETMAAGMNALGGMNNTGEGGEDPDRYNGPNAQGWDLNSGIKQIASGRFGVTIHYLVNAKELQIKMAQGAKPGEGGQLPGHKVTPEIARIRYSIPGVSLISPPPHHDIYSIEDLAQLIYDLKCANPGVKVSVKLVSEVGVGIIASGVAKGNADEVLISGHDGGTGASPLSSIKHAGSPWELGLSETQQTLVLNGLRDRIRLQTDGQLRTGRDVVIAALLGAERFGFGTAALVSLGCVMMRKCHLGTCPVGVATQDPELRKRFKGTPAHLMNFMHFVARDVRKIMARLGVRKLEDMVGRVDFLETRSAIDHYKARDLDLSAIFKAPDGAAQGRALCCIRPQADTIDAHMDWRILEQIGDGLKSGVKVDLDFTIKNTDRTIGAILSNRVTKLHGPGGFADDTIQLNFSGSAGQSFGAFLAPGLTLKLTGDANDYLGKGLSGGKIILKTPPEARFIQHDNIIAGNTLLYGATSGEVYINGLVGERFAVRNSGAVAVVEGVGDHGCEYMTGGVVAVLGRTGYNFAAGMSGGIAYVLDEQQLFDTRCNLDMVDLESVWLAEDIKRLKDLIIRHHKYTDSKQARYILDNWRDMIGRFVKVMPIDYRKSLERIQLNDSRETDTTPATEEVFR